MTAHPRSDTDPGGRVRVPADVERPDRILAGLTARQLAILAVAATALWALYSATRQIVPLAVFAVGAFPVAAVAVGLAVGKIDGQPADRYATAAIRSLRSPRRLIPAPDHVPPAPALLGSVTGPVPAPLRLPLSAIGEHGTLDLGPDGTAVICRARAVPFKLRVPAEQHAMVAGFGRYLNSLAEPIQIVVRAIPVDLKPAADRIRSAAPGLPHPALEAAAVEHAHFLSDVSGQGLLARQVLVVLRHPSPAADVGGDDLVRRAGETATALAAAGVIVEPLDRDSAAAALAAAFDPAGPSPLSGYLDDTIVAASGPTRAETR